MTRLPSDSFLPAGALLDNEMHLSVSGDSSSSSVISPLTLPRSLGATGYFDQQRSVTSHPSSGPNAASHSTLLPSAAVNGNRSGNRVSSPLSPGLRGPPQPQPAHFLSPRLAPTSTQLQYQLRQQHHQQRSASLSPTRRTAAISSAPGRTRTRSAMVSPSPAPTGGFVSLVGGLGQSLVPGLVLAGNTISDPLVSTGTAEAGQPRSVSADAVNLPSSPQMVQRLVQQNARLRDAWEAERKYMEANRGRAEEVYKEERALMEEERAAWLTDRTRLLEEIALLRQHVVGLGGAGLLSNHNAASRASGGFVSSQNLRGGGWEVSPESMRSSESSQGNAQSRNEDTPQAGRPGIAFHGPSPARPLYGEYQGQGAVGLSLPNQYQASTLVPGTQELGSDPMAPGGTDETAVPTVDVQEIHPELEGIPIKARAIQKPTFTDKPASSPPGSKPSSGKPSPPTDPVNAAVPPKRQSKEQTLRMLAADESDRLTMHAGHTPNHSLSYLPTVTASEAVTAASSSGSNTPTMQDQEDVTIVHREQPVGVQPRAKGKDRLDTSNPIELPGLGVDQVREEPDAILEVPGDKPLRGPLMVRNMPAHDEIFFQQLSDKLQEVSRGSDSIPSVLKDMGYPGPSSEQPRASAKTGRDATADRVDKGASKSDDEEEMEIPLKLKRSNNFGAPFGEFRK